MGPIEKCGTVDQRSYQWVLFAQFLETMQVAERREHVWTIPGDLTIWETPDGQMVVQSPQGYMVLIPDWWREECDAID